MQGVVPAQPLEASPSSALPSSRDDHSVQDSGPRGFGSVIKSKEAVICVALGSAKCFHSHCLAVILPGATGSQ